MYILTYETLTINVAVCLQLYLYIYDLQLTFFGIFFLFENFCHLFIDIIHLFLIHFGFFIVCLHTQSIIFNTIQKQYQHYNTKKRSHKNMHVSRDRYRSLQAEQECVGYETHNRSIFGEKIIPFCPHLTQQQHMYQKHITSPSSLFNGLPHNKLETCLCQQLLLLLFISN